MDAWYHFILVVEGHPVYIRTWFRSRATIFAAHAQAPTYITVFFLQASYYLYRRYPCVAGRHGEHSDRSGFAVGRVIVDSGRRPRQRHVKTSHTRVDRPQSSDDES